MRYRAGAGWAGKLGAADLLTKPYTLLKPERIQWLEGARQAVSILTSLCESKACSRFELLLTLAPSLILHADFPEGLEDQCA
jgi:hypothetical protein